MITGVPAALPRRNLVGEIPEDNKKQAVFTACLFGGDAGVCLTAIVTEGQSRAAEGVHTATPCCDFSKLQ